MLQKTYTTYTMKDVVQAVQDVCMMPERTTSKCILLKMLFSQTSEEQAESVRRYIQDALPDVKIVGMLQTEFGNAYDAQHLCVVLGFHFFEQSEVKVLEYGGHEDYTALGRSLGRELRDMPNVKGIEVFFAGRSQFLTSFLDELSAENEDIPMFGVDVEVEDLYELQQSKNFFSEITHAKMPHYLVTNHVFLRGVVLVLYMGQELHLQVDYLLGWKALGRYMTISGVEENHIVSRIDGMPATDIYKKYLNVRPDEYFIFNICEFPVVSEREGELIARVPNAYNDNKQLYFNSELHEGDQIRLSYANPQNLLHETWTASEHMRGFGAQAISLVICGNRKLFLKDKAQMEIDVYERIQKGTLAFYGQSEIFRHRRRGGILNSALVAVGYREGPLPLSMPIHLESDKEYIYRMQRDIIPLTDRLSAFIDAMTDELYASNRELKEMAIAAKSANKAKSQFLSNMSHEIRTPINAILGMNEMILRECRDTALLEYAENIRTASANLLGLVNDILDFSKIEAGKMDIIPVEYELASVLNDLVNMIRGRAEKKGLELKIESNERLPSYLYGDEIRIKQVATNILTNAVKYTEKGSVTMCVDFEKAGEDSILLKFSIRDTGIGIKPEDKEKLFKPFERIEEERNRSIEGTGLGMNITIKLLALMDSKLDVESVYGEGSVFSFAVRQKVVKWEPVGNFEDAYRRSLSQHEAYQERFTAPDAVILVVDDTPMNLKVVQGLLKQTKIQIDTAESGLECLHLVEKNKYDIIFLDHRMPKMDGIETLAAMREMGDYANSGTPVVALTANAVSGAREEYLAAGFTDYLTKPINSVQLERMIAFYLPKEKLKISKVSKNRAEDAEPAGTLPAWLRESGLDVNSGLKYCGSKEGYLEAVGIFHDAIDEIVRNLKYRLDTGDIKNYTIQVHSIKSSSRIIGANELSERAKRLEDAGNQGFVEEIQKDTPALLHLLTAYKDVLAPIHESDKAEADLPEIEMGTLAEAYEAMQEIAASFDYDSMMFVFQSLEKYRIPQKEQEFFSQLKAAAKKPDWETVYKLLNEK